MDEVNPRLFEVFLDVQRGLPRQGPGNNECTLETLSLCSGLPDNPVILDIGCGPGMQTLALAKASQGNLTAVDNCEEYLNILHQWVTESDLTGQVKIINADMNDLCFADASFDLIWCEGAAYIMGVPNALKTWRPLLRDRGYLAFTELVWLEEHPATDVAEFFGNEYPAMTNINSIKNMIESNGYENVSDFTLPDAAWWEDYYTPLADKLPILKQKYAGDEESLAIISMTENEIECRRRFGHSYGYQFFVTRKRNE
ncbi:class I SAM-dependent methyltransferase [uncultured Gimesia sp.]|uniref:class I SAM-dependent methyltransferase n=1 Tax=uncultured Gimesia sp. TaxID=1678688 RepID=UPI00262B2032|nr:class I SAM-dependent methyltransferase [uncultured Gimesia sp.]